MTTLVYVGNSEGCVGRCDAKCYEAEGGNCDCICGGVSHGKGLEQATDNTRELAQAQINAIEARGGYISPEIRQLALL